MTQTAKQQPQVPPQVIALHDGYYASVNGRLFGPWACKEYAQAGLAVEIRRANKRTLRTRPWRYSIPTSQGVIKRTTGHEYTFLALYPNHCRPTFHHSRQAAERGVYRWQSPSEVVEIKPEHRT